MIPYNKARKAFSLIEVVFVLVILGIISSISSSIIVQVYESYITQNALYKVSTTTELVANQLVNRLTYAIPISTISKVTNNNGAWVHATPPIEDTDWIQLKNIMFGNSSFKTIEWIGYDNDSFSASVRPGWSGVANYSTSTETLLNTPASNLTLSRDIIWNLSNNKVDMDDPTNFNTPAVVFKEKDNYYTGVSEYSPTCMGLIDNNSSCIFPVQRNNDTQLQFIGATANTPKIITERYNLAWSAYAVVPEDPDGDNLWDLYLYSNYQPWNGETYNNKVYNANGLSPEGISKKLLMKNVSVFKFTKNGGIIQFKLCASSQISSTNYISTCKEKVVLR